MSLSAHRVAVSVFFALSGFGFGGWVARIPDMKAKLGFDEGTLGAALLAPSIGALVAMPLAGLAAARFGSRAPTLLMALATALAFGLLGMSVGFMSLFATLTLLGFANGALDLSMNVQAAAVERRYGRPIMSSFHGLFSLGGLAGGLAGAWAAESRLGLPLHLWLNAAALTVAALAAAPGLMRDRPDAAEPTAGFRLPGRALLPVAVIAFCGLLGEGAVADWSAVLLRENYGTSPGFAAIGFVAFSLTMTLGRFLGDAVTARLGPAAVVAWGGGLCAAGLGIGLTVAEPLVMVVGFAAVGLGLSCMIPVTFSAAARIGEPGPSIAAVSTFGYVAFFVGPPAIGHAAEATSLPLALGLVAALGILAAVLAPAVRVRAAAQSARQGQRA